MFRTLRTDFISICYSVFKDRLAVAVTEPSELSYRSPVGCQGQKVLPFRLARQLIPFGFSCRARTGCTLSTEGCQQKMKTFSNLGLLVSTRRNITSFYRPRDSVDPKMFAAWRGRWSPEVSIRDSVTIVCRIECWIHSLSASCPRLCPSVRAVLARCSPRGLPWATS
jgi:hypothetical protein